MSSSGRGWKGGKKTGATRPQARASASSSHRGWKSEKKVTSGRHRGPATKKLPQLFGIGCLLIGLLGIAIWIWWPDHQVHTHFVIVNPLQGSSRFPYEARVEFPESNAAAVGWFESGKHSVSQSTSLNFTNEEGEVSGDDALLQDADVSIIFYRAMTVPGKDHKHLALLKNSKPDLQADDQFEDLGMLKKRLSELPKKQQKLLIVDVNSMDSDWRAGFFGDSLHRELISWTEADELENLIVVLSCDVGESSWPSGLPGWGGTVFESVLEQAFSSQADTNGNDALSLEEFVEYLTKKTNEWVVAHRSSAGQHVQVYPKLETLAEKSPGQSIVLMKSLSQRPSREPMVNAARDLLDDLPELWRQAATTASGAQRNVSPILQTSATAQLRFAEASLEEGKLDVAERWVTMARDNFLDAERVEEPAHVVLAQTDSVLAYSGVKAWLAGFQLQAVPNNDVPGLQSYEILRRNIEAYPFQQIGLNPPDEAEINEIVGTRQRFEIAAALAFRNPGQLRPILLDLQRRLLFSEDLLFADQILLSSDQSAASHGKVRREIDAAVDRIEEFVLLQLEVEQFQFEVLGELADYAKWASANAEQLYVRDLLSALRSRSTSQIPLDATPLEKLPFTISNSLNDMEGLLQEYAVQLDARFAEVDEVAEAHRALKEKFESARNSWKKLQETAEKIDYASISRPIDRWREASRASFLPNFNKDKRLAAIEAAGFPWLAGELQTAVSTSSSDGSSVEQIVINRDRSVWKSVWALRLHDLLEISLSRSTNPAPQAMAKVWDVWKRLETATTADEVHEQLYQLRTMLLARWKAARNQLVQAQAMSPTDLHGYAKQLATADLTARYFSADDFDDLTQVHRGLRGTISRVQQIDYGLLLSQLALQSKWVQPGSAKIASNDFWYIKNCNAWLSHVESSIAKDGHLSGLQSFVADQRQDLEQVENWSMAMVPPKSLFFEGEEQQLDLILDSRLSGNLPESGVASLFVLDAQAEAESTPILGVPKNGIPVAFDEPVFRTELAIRRLRIPAGEKPQEFLLRSELFYRGRRPQQASIPVNPYPAKERTWQYLADRSTAEIRVRGNDHRPVVFVLDWSYSMSPEPKVGETPKQRHLAAINALEEIIKGLLDDKEAAETMRVGLVIFGHRSRDGANEVREYNATFPTAFESFKGNVNLQMEIAPNDDVQVLHEIGLLKTGSAALLEKLERLRNVKPWGTTPLGLAMKTAAEQLSIEGKEGGIVVAMTDGVPTDLGNAAFASHHRRFEELKKQLAPAEIDAVILALDLGEDQSALSTLKCVFGDGTVPCQSAFMEGKDPLNVPILETQAEGDTGGGLLRSVIDDKLQARNFVIQRRNNEIVGQGPLSDTTVVVAADQSYKVTFGDFTIQDVRVAKGDSVLLDVNWSKERFDVNRDLPNHHSENASPVVNTEQDAPSILRVVEVIEGRANSTDNGNVDAITINVMLDHSKLHRPVRKPSEIWFSVSASADSSFVPDAVTQTYSSEFGAPGWKLEVSPWPMKSAVRVNAFWKMERTTPDEVIPLQKLAEARSRESALMLGGAPSLPRFKIWQKRTKSELEDVYEVRLESLDQGDFQSLSELRVECGEWGVQQKRETFQPDNVPHLKTTVGTNVVIHRFEYPASGTNFEPKVIALTSLASRQKGASALEKPIQVVERTIR